MTTIQRLTLATFAAFSLSFATPAFATAGHVSGVAVTAAEQPAETGSASMATTSVDADPALFFDDGAGTAAASDPSGSGDPLVESAGLLVTAVRAGDWRKTVALALLLIVVGWRKYGAKIPLVGSWAERAMATDLGGTLFVFGLAFAGALGTSLLGDAPVDWKMFRAALDIGAGAAAGWSVIWKRLALPLGVKVVGWIRGMVG